MQEDKLIQLIKDQTESLLKLMSVEATVEARIEENPIKKILYVSIQSENGGSLIGFRGQTLHSIQHLLNQMNIQSKALEEHKLIVDINNYRNESIEKLKSKALSAAEYVKENKKDYDFGFMAPFDRRIVHITIAEIDGVTTESIGNGRMKRLLVKTKE